jgi:CDP-glycerol glycerophosphotransferase (TagB/SpsB family)
MVSEIHHLIEFAPDVVILADSHAALLRARLPNAVFVWVRHGLSSKNVTRYAARVCDYACLTSEASRDGYIARGARPRRDFWITGFLQMDPLFRGDPMPLPIELAADRKTVVYAPTWNADLASAPMLGERIVELIRGDRRDVSVIIKPHPVIFHRQLDWMEIWRRLAAADPHVYLVDEPEADVKPYLKAADVMISDASSTIFEYLGVDRPIVLLSNPRRFTSSHFDQQGIEWRWRDVGEEVHDVDNLAAAVGRGLDNPALGAERRAHYRHELLGDLTDGHAGQRIADHIAALEL